VRIDTSIQQLNTEQRLSLQTWTLTGSFKKKKKTLTIRPSFRTKSPKTNTKTPSGYAQNPLHTFPRNFAVDGEVANLLLVVDLWRKLLATWPTEFGKRHDTTDTTDFCLRQLVTDLSFMLWTCCRLAT